MKLPVFQILPILLLSACSSQLEPEPGKEVFMESPCVKVMWRGTPFTVEGVTLSYGPEEWSERNPGGIYKGAPMTNGMQLTWGGIWMHEGLVTSAPESHGCIRLPKRMAKIFFDNTPVGTPVEIK